jgi:hypothetical protein
MPHATLVNNTDLHLWASRRESQSKLPQLMRRLIRATVANIKRLNFPSDESVQLGGWDGIVEVETGNDFVPDGTSVWELGVNRNVKDKADEDYEKRTANPSEINPETTTFIFVTPRRWGGKDDWVKEKVKQGKWLDVRAYDADDIEAFLEIAPAVHIWASILLGKRPEGAIDISHYWEEWVSVTRPQTTTTLVIAGRQEEVNRVSEWLQGPPSCLSLQAETQDEAVAFLAACIQLLPDDIKTTVIERAVVVENEVEWRRLSICAEALFLVPTFGDRSLVASAVQRGHHVLLPLGLSEAKTIANVALNRPHREAVHQALEEMKFPQHQISDLATLGRRSLSVLRRRLAINPSLLVPQWAEPSEARLPLPALLVGRWQDSNEADRKLIARLAGCEYSQVNEVLLRWANAAYPFVRRVGDVWLVVSKEDSWLLLSRFLTGDDMRRFEEAALEVLGQADPKYELDVEQRRIASFLGEQLSHSGFLRAGIAETLALMAARSDIAPLVDASTGQDWADRIIYKLFSSVVNWEHWATLDRFLVSFAEASPDNFLNAVDSIVTGEQPIAVNLFRQEDSYWGGPEHTGLLWALELLAWSPQFLSRSAILLAQLTRLDPGGKWGNRPQSSLHNIFLTLYPCTMAGPEQRLKTIDLIRKQEPDVAWNLMLGLIPQLHMNTTVHKTHTPDFREWGTDAWAPVTWAEVRAMVREIVARLIEDVGTNEIRWNSLIPLLDDLPDDQFGILVEKMRETFTALTGDESSERLCASSRECLRDLLSCHMSYPDAKWSMSKERIEQLREIYIKLEPQDLVSRYAWQFAHQGQFMLPETENWQERHDQIDKMRKQTVQEIYETGGLPDVLRLAQQSEDPSLVGWALGSLMSIGAQEDDFLAQTLGATENYLVLLGMGYCRGRLVNDANWLQTKLSSAIVAQGTPLQKANFYLCLASDRGTWDLAKAAGEEVESIYWGRVNPWGHGKLSEGDLQHLIESLASHGRLTEALHYISLQSHSKEGQLPPVFIMGILEMAISEGNVQQVDWSQLVHDIPHLLKIIEASKEVDDERLGQLELLFISWLEYSEYQPKALMRSLNENPKLFCELVELVFRGENDEPRELSPEEQSRNLQAYNLLRLWRTIPGSDEQGNINGEKLSAWVAEARALVNACGRGVIGEQQIGQLLSHSPKGTDGLWPHEAVRRVIEEVASKELEKGFDVGVFNNRGVTTRSLTEGGVQEREIAVTYREYALNFRDVWPRTSQMLDRMASDYERYGRREDLDADLTQDLWR